jgi:hypothetical protein
MTSGKTTLWRPRPSRCFAAAVFSLLILAGALPCAQAQEASPGTAQQRPPVQDAQPRRDYQMGTTQGNIFIDRDQQGDSVIEVKPKPPAQDQQQQQMNMGPIIVVPRVNQK